MRREAVLRSLQALAYFCVVSLFFSLLAPNARAQGTPVWQQVPLRTQKQKDAGLFGGEGFQATQDIEYAPSNPNILYMIVDTTPPWKSTNGGNNWFPVFNGYGSCGGMSLRIHPTNPNMVFVAGSWMGDNMPLGARQGIFRTIDGGANWSFIKPVQFFRVSASKGGSLFAFSGANTVYAGTHGDGLLRSTDGGTSWNTIVSNPNYITDLKIHPTDPTILYIATSAGLYRVNDNGTVTATKIGTAGLPANPSQIAINKTTPSIMYVTTGVFGVYRSADSGATFSPRNNGMAATLNAGYKAHNISISPADPNYLYVGYNRASAQSPWGHFYSHDGGANWSVPENMDVGGYLASMDNWFGIAVGHSYGTYTAFHPTDKSIAMAIKTSETPLKTTDGGVTWTYSSNGYTGGAVNQGIMTPIGWDINNPNRYFVFLADWGPFFTTDNGDTFVWRRAQNSFGWGSANGGAIDYTPNSQIVVTASGEWDQQGLMVSRNLGTSWTGITNTIDNYKFIAFHPQNNNIVYANRYKFTNIQTNNNYIQLPKIVWGMYPRNGNIVYSLGWTGGVTTIYKSTDGGITWTSPYPTIPAMGHPGTIAIDPKNENRVYVAIRGASPRSGNGIWVINDTLANGGMATVRNDTHGLIRDQFNELNYYYVAVDPRNPNILYAAQASRYKGSSNGVFRSLDSGNTWTNISGNLTTWFSPNAITVNPHNSYVYVGSFAGTWKLPPPGTSNTDAIAPSGSLSINNGAASTNSSNVNLNLSATDSVGVTAYYVANSSTPPPANSSGWVGVSSSTSFSKAVSHALTAGTGIKTVYAWYKDAAGNVSTTASDAIEVLADSALSVSANKTLSPLSIDGSLVESVWSLSQTLNKTISGTNNNTTTFGVLWDSTYLYVGIKVLDSNLLNDSADPWGDDSIEVYIDGKHEHSSTYDANDRQFVKGYNDTALLSSQSSTGVLHSTANIAGGYTVEMAIPWSNLGLTPAADMSMGFDVQNNDDDNSGGRDGAKDWNSSQDLNYTSTVNFGHLVLSATTVGQDTAPAAPTGLRVMP